MATSSASGSEEGTFQHGVVLFLNMYLSRTHPSKHLLESTHRTPVHVYIILNGKQHVEPNVDRRDMPSNTLGIGMVAAQAKAVHGMPMWQYPCLCAENVVMQVVQKVGIP